MNLSNPRIMRLLQTWSIQKPISSCGQEAQSKGAGVLQSLSLSANFTTPEDRKLDIEEAHPSKVDPGLGAAPN